MDLIKTIIYLTEDQLLLCVRTIQQNITIYTIYSHKFQSKINKYLKNVISNN